MAFGVTEVGFATKLFQDCFNDTQNRLRARLNDVTYNIDFNQFGGSVIEAILYEIENVWQEMVEIYNNAYIDTANGISLDYIGNLFGVIREIGEDDDTYRARIKLEKSKKNVAIYDAIYGAMISLNYVKTAFLFDPNTSLKQTADGTIEVNLASQNGGFTSTEKQEIADVLKQTVACGIKTLGSEVINVTQINGQQREIRFNEIQSTNIYVKVQNATLFGNLTQTQSIEQIKINLKKYVNELLCKTLGNDVVFENIKAEIIGNDTDIEQALVSISKDNVTFIQSNLSIDNDKIPNLLDENIIITFT